MQLNILSTGHPLSCDKLTLRGRLFTGVLLVLAFVCYSLFSYYVPFTGDDYSLPFDWMVANNGVWEFSWGRLLGFAEYSRSIDNSRLDNLLFMAMRMSGCPKWSFAIVIGLSAAVMLWACARLCSPRRTDMPLVLAAMWGWVAFTFPWRFGSMGIDNSFNVLLPSAITVTFLLLMRRVADVKLPAWVFAAGCLLAMVGGWIHEGYSATLCCGLGVWALVKRFRLPWQWWVLAVLFGLAAVYAISAPGLWKRLDFTVQASAGSPVNVKTLLTLIMPMLALGVVVVTGSVYASCTGTLRGRVAGLLKSQVFVVPLVAFVVSAAMVLKSTPGNPRALWIADLYATLVMFQLIGWIFKTWSRRILTGLSGVVFLLLGVFYVNVIRTQRQIGIEEREISRQMDESEWGTVYRGYRIDMSKLTLLHPLKAPWRTRLHINSYNWLYPGKKVYAVVPPAFESITDEMVDYIEGKICLRQITASDPNDLPEKLEGTAGVYSYHDELLMPDERMVLAGWIAGGAQESCSAEATYDIECKDGRRFDRVGATKIRFLTRSGRPLIYIAPGHAKVTGPYKSVSVVE